MTKRKAIFGDRVVGDGHKCFVTAEIGINGNGDPEIVERLIDVAVEAGCDAVKFQKRTVPVVYTPEELAQSRRVDEAVLRNAVRRGVLSPEAVKRLEESGFQNSTNGDLKWALEFTREEYERFDHYCRERRIMWFGTPWDEESVDFLALFDPPAYKIASASLTDDGLLAHIAKAANPGEKAIILSTGMSTLDQVRHAVEILGQEDLIILHAVSTYPAENDEINLSCIKTLGRIFPEVPIGYSGHERGIDLSLCAVVLGACMVERHITLDRTMWGSDQAASVEPGGLERLIRNIRMYEDAYGDGVKRVLEREVPVMKKLRRK